MRKSPSPNGFMINYKNIMAIMNKLLMELMHEKLQMQEIPGSCKEACNHISLKSPENYLLI